MLTTEQIGSRGVGNGQWTMVYVTDWGNDRVQVLTMDGRFIRARLGKEELDKGISLLLVVYVHVTGFVYVVDRNNCACVSVH